MLISVLLVGTNACSTNSKLELKIKNFLFWGPVNPCTSSKSSAEGFLDNWKAVNNLGYPINSSKEDLYYAAGADYQSGYFTSDRMDCKDCAGPACLKLYEIKVPPLRYKTTALDAETMEPIEGVVIELMDSSAKFKYQETLSNEKGSVIIEMEPASDYTIKASKKGCLTESLKYSTVNKPIKWYHGRF
ncbi:MAG: OOP family OmpA-OmpF porin [Sphingobacteriales bacterium]